MSNGTRSCCIFEIDEQGMRRLAVLMDFLIYTYVFMAIILIRIQAFLHLHELYPVRHNCTNRIIVISHVHI